VLEMAHGRDGVGSQVALVGVDEVQVARIRWPNVFDW